jgi:hypothetical protein
MGHVLRDAVVFGLKFTNPSLALLPSKQNLTECCLIRQAHLVQSTALDIAFLSPGNMYNAGPQIMASESEEMSFALMV